MATGSAFRRQKLASFPCRFPERRAAKYWVVVQVVLCTTSLASISAPFRLTNNSSLSNVSKRSDITNTYNTAILRTTSEHNNNSKNNKGTEINYENRHDATMDAIRNKSIATYHRQHVAADNIPNNTNSSVEGDQFDNTTVDDGRRRVKHTVAGVKMSTVATTVDGEDFLNSTPGGDGESRQQAGQNHAPNATSPGLSHQSNTERQTSTPAVYTATELQHKPSSGRTSDHSGHGHTDTVSTPVLTASELHYEPSSERTVDHPDHAETDTGSTPVLTATGLQHEQRSGRTVDHPDHGQTDTGSTPVHKASDDQDKATTEAEAGQGGGGSEEASDPCRLTQTQKTLRSLTGTIAWTERDDGCRRGDRKWTIHATEGLGVAIDFHRVSLSRGTLLLHCSGGPPGDPSPILERQLASVSPCVFYPFPVHPLVTQAPRVILTYRAWRGSSVGDASSFSLTYHALPSLPRPVKIAPSPGSPPLLSASTVYNCSQAVVPPPLRCNRVEECVDGEDEAGCGYRTPGCGDWVPHGNRCLKVSFPSTTGRGAAQFSNADRKCEEAYGARLAALPDKAGVALVSAMVRRAGFCEVFIRISKMAARDRRLRPLYRFQWQWGGAGGPVVYDQPDLERAGPMFSCAVLKVLPTPVFLPRHCSAQVALFPSPSPTGIVCSKPSADLDDDDRGGGRAGGTKGRAAIRLPAATRLPDRFSTKTCPDGSVVHVFHRCRWGEERRYDVGYAQPCFHDDGRFSNADAGLPPSPFPAFPCLPGQPVHYSLLCDGIEDCLDGSDERRCVPRPRFPPLVLAYFRCATFQLVPLSRRCDGTPDCMDGSDESMCFACREGLYLCQGMGCISRNIRVKIDSCMPSLHAPPVSASQPFPSLVRLTGMGTSELVPAPNSTAEGVFPCYPGFFIPTYLLSNGEKDCPGGEDEVAEAVFCPGYYRCHDTGTCLHADLVCDGIHHCANKDDERYCNLTCPQVCTCEGHAYICDLSFDPTLYPLVRYLQFTVTSNISFENFHVLELLQFLNLSRCGLRSLALLDMPGLRILDLSFNEVENVSVSTLTHLTGLEHLDLSGNALVPTLGPTFTSFLSDSGLHGLQVLVLKDLGRLRAVDDSVFAVLTDLRRLDLRDNSLVNYGSGIFKGLDDLDLILTDDPRLCCPYFRPTHSRCVSPEDHLSSCEDLLRHVLFRASLWLLSLLSVAGNVGVMAYRAFRDRTTTCRASRTLVFHLSVSDLLMGVRMAVVGAADARYRGRYVSEDRRWRASVACRAAGVLGLASSEVSGLVLCLITLDRVLALTLPLRRDLHLTPRHAAITSLLSWTIGLALAAGPLVVPSLGPFYRHNAVCLPLPLAARGSPGQAYAFAIFTCLNFLLAVLVGAGQAVIYLSVRRARAACGCGASSRDVAVARRLLLVGLSHFCCWFPLGLLGLLSSCLGLAVGGWVRVGLGVVVAPINAALDPFLYTLSGLLHRWRSQREREGRERLIRQLRAARAEVKAAPRS